MSVATWNYRIIQFPNGAKQLHEVFYDDDGTLTSWTAEPAVFVCDETGTVNTIAMSLSQALGDTLRATELGEWSAEEETLPVLMADDLPGSDE